MSNNLKTFNGLKIKISVGKNCVMLIEFISSLTLAYSFFLKDAYKDRKEISKFHVFFTPRTIWGVPEYIMDSPYHNFYTRCTKILSSHKKPKELWFIDPVFYLLPLSYYSSYVRVHRDKNREQTFTCIHKRSTELPSIQIYS